MKNIFKKVIVSSFLLSLIFGVTGCTANTIQNDSTNVKTTIQQQIPDIQYKSITKLNKISPTTKIAAKTILASMDKATTEMEEYLTDNHKQEEKDSLYALYINNMYYYTELLKSNLSINAMYDYPRPEHTSFTANGLNFAYDNTQLYLAYNDFTHSLINMKYAGEGVYLPDFDIYYQAMMFSKTAITVDKEANDINKKKSEPQILPPVIETKTLGNVIKIKLGPLSGLIPKEKHAGKIINPAIIATKVSNSATFNDSFNKVCSLFK